MQLVNRKSYFISKKDVVIRSSASGRAKPLNHLIFGDWILYLGEKKRNWAKVHSRGTKGWIPISAIQKERILEVNFVDVGQGDGCHIVTPEDEVILIDAGVSDNMFRFLHWRYNLRSRKVVGVDGVTETDRNTRAPFEIDYVVISHPDKDHYNGFEKVFECKKLKINRVYHNGIVERPIKAADKDPDLYYYSGGDLGGYVKGENKSKFLWDVVKSNSAMRTLLRKHKNTRKKYIPVLAAALENNSDVQFQALSANDDYFDKFDENADLTFKILGPITEKKSKGNSSRDCLKRLGNEGETKNGHSIVLQLWIGRLKVMLGGDLNTLSEDYLLQHYCNTNEEVSELEHLISKLKAKGDNLNSGEKQELAEAESALANVIVKARKHFQVDISKACHHGSHHFSETFLKSLNTIATIVSSGDNESYAHPRPDALGSFGKFGRGDRPLIFSTELARSSNEFVEIFKYFKILEDYKAKIAAAPTSREKKTITDEMESRKDSNVARYGMITLRTDGEKVFIAQKLEASGGNDNKWDIHEIHYNKNTKEFEYLKKTGH